MYIHDRLRMARHNEGILNCEYSTHMWIVWQNDKIVLYKMGTSWIVNVMPIRGHVWHMTKLHIVDMMSVLISSPCRLYTCSSHTANPKHVNNKQCTWKAQGSVHIGAMVLHRRLSHISWEGNWQKFHNEKRSRVCAQTRWDSYRFKSTRTARESLSRW